MPFAPQQGLGTLGAGPSVIRGTRKQIRGRVKARREMQRNLGVRDPATGELTTADPTEEEVAAQKAATAAALDDTAVTTEPPPKAAAKKDTK